MGNQERMDSFFQIDNLIEIRISMPTDRWTVLRDSLPAGGQCNHAYQGDRYEWVEATSVSVTGSRFPSGGEHTFQKVGVKKKSYCGSFSTTKPSLKLDFGKFKPENESGVEDLIGTRRLVLNNSVQDDSYVRQTLGYALFKAAGLPAVRCAYARVFVNGSLLGVYVVVEEIHKRFLDRNFGGNDASNLYEIEVGEDLVPSMVAAGRLEHKGFSALEDGADLKYAADRIAAGAPEDGVALDQYLRFSAMECLLKHWDGYNGARNNTYLYNDAIPIAHPDAAHVNIKFIPWGIDQILQPNHHVRLYGDSILARTVRASPALLRRQMDQIRALATTIFEQESHDTLIDPLLQKMRAVLGSAGLTGISGAIDEVRLQVRMVKSAAFQLLGERPTDAVMLIAVAGGDCVRAALAEEIGDGFEVVHRAPRGDREDRFWLQSSDTQPGAVKVQSRRFRSYLHASIERRTAAGTLEVYHQWEHPHPGHYFTLEPDGATTDGGYMGRFRLKSVRTGQFVRFAASPPQEIDQIPDAEKGTVFYLL